jgi:ADP-ribose pyrophosphatase YjhB (NUDIX family)
MKYSWQEFQYCPRCGARYPSDEFRARTVSLICAECRYEFFQNSSPAATVVVPSKTLPREIILLTRSIPPGKGLLALPGGFLQYREPPSRAAQREVSEEILLQIDLDRLLDSYLVDYEFRGIIVSVVELVYLSKPVEYAVTQLHTSEAASVGYYDVAAFQQSAAGLAFPEQQQALRRYCEYLSSLDHALHN